MEPTKFKIEKGVKIPPAKRALGIAQTLRQMKVGDSFFSEEPLKNIYTYSKLVGMKFSQRKDGAGVRIWRVK